MSLGKLKDLQSLLGDLHRKLDRGLENLVFALQTPTSIENKKYIFRKINTLKEQIEEHTKVLNLIQTSIMDVGLKIGELKEGNCNASMNPRKAFEQVINIRKGSISKSTSLGARIDHLYNEFLEHVSEALHEMDEDVADVVVLDWIETSSGKQLEGTVFIAGFSKKDVRISVQNNDSAYDVARKTLQQIKPLLW